MQLAYTYYIKNKITNQFYYGSRCKNIKLNKSAKEDFWVIYFTSSKEIKSLRNIYGNDSFEYTILCESEDYDSCFWYEQNLIKENIDNSLCINIQYQDKDSGHRIFSGQGPCTNERRLAISKSKKGEKNPFFGRSHSAESKKKISVASKGKPKSEETRQKMSAAAHGHTNQVGAKNSMFGRKHTEESREKIRQKAFATQERKRTEKALLVESRELFLLHGG